MTTRRRSIATGLLVALALSGCGPSEDGTTLLAAGGHTDDRAPIRASRSIVIAAPPARIWAVLADVDRWPTWNDGIGTAHLDGALRPGTSFEWTNDGTAIASRLALVEPPARIAWTGRAMGLTAIHVWTLRPLADGRTVVGTTESMRGFPSSLFYASGELATANGHWLARLKTAVERKEATHGASTRHGPAGTALPSRRGVPI